MRRHQGQPRGRQQPLEGLRVAPRRGQGQEHAQVFMDTSALMSADPRPALPMAAESFPYTLQ